MNLPPHALLIAYLLVGPLFWIALAFAMFKGRQRMQILREPYGELPEPPPLVSVLVPAKDEATRIEKCIRSIQQLDYSDLEIIAIDDRSTDSTPALLRELASEDSRMKVIQVREAELPAGWGGKNLALHRGAQAAGGQWLLFVDADVRLTPQALSIPLRVAHFRRFGMISLLPALVTDCFWERLLQPVGGAATSAMFLIALNNYNEVSNAFANGQFMLVRRDAYDAVGGHEAVRGALSEDTAMARRLKDAGLRPRIAWGNGYADVRMYESFGQIFHGWARNFYIGTQGRPWRIMLSASVLLVCCFSFFAALAIGVWSRDLRLLAIAAAHLATMAATFALIYSWNRTPARYALLFPLAASILLAIFGKSLMMCVSGRVEWRGTRYTRDRKLQFSRT